MQIGTGQAGSAGESRWQMKVTFQVVIIGASAGGLGVIPPAMAVTLLGHFVGLLEWDWVGCMNLLGWIGESLHRR